MISRFKIKLKNFTYEYKKNNGILNNIFLKCGIAPSLFRFKQIDIPLSIPKIGGYSFKIIPDGV